MSVHMDAVLPPTLLGKGQMFHFTPAGTANRPGRSVTVAVRIDPIAVRGILVRAASPAGTVHGAVPLAIAPTGFNLGVSRGYHSFAQSLVPTGEARKSDTTRTSALWGKS